MPHTDGIDENETLKLRRYLLGLCLVAGRSQPDYNLRQGYLLVLKSNTDPALQLVYPSGKREPFEWDLEGAFKFATSAAEQFVVTGGGEHAFEKTKVEAALKEKVDSKAKKKAGKAGN